MVKNSVRSNRRGAVLNGGIIIGKRKRKTFYRQDLPETFKELSHKQLRQFSTGATRNRAEGKGRFDLIPPSALKRIARVYERGAKKNGENNWTLGIPFSSLIDSATRHLNEWRYNKLTKTEPQEDHLAHAAWNILALMHFEDMGCESLDDVWEVKKPNANRN